MLKHHRCWVERKGVRRRDVLIDQGPATKYLDSHLEWVAGSFSKDAGIKVEIVHCTDGRADRLRKRVALEVASGTERGGMGSTGRPFGVIGNVRTSGPSGNGAVSVKRTGLKIPVYQC